jgi:hypothetical protein
VSRELSVLDLLYTEHKPIDICHLITDHKTIPVPGCISAMFHNALHAARNFNFTSYYTGSFLYNEVIYDPNMKELKECIKNGSWL